MAATAGAGLDAPVDLAATPLFGGLLSGVRITGFGVSYASQAFAAGDIVLPSGPDGGAGVRGAAGFGLTVTVNAGGRHRPSPSRRRPGNILMDRPGPPTRASGAADAAAGHRRSTGSTCRSRSGRCSSAGSAVAASGTLGLAIDASLTTDVVDIDLTGFTVAFTPGA